MNHASLFSGIGGFDLAAQWMGWNNIFQVEKDEWCQSILAKHFPNTERYLDIKEFNGEKYKGSIDIISGGFPCQPFSVAGKQKGTSDDRYLWPEMLRVIREIQPTWIVGENVPGIISLALDQVYVDLENEGYTVQAFIIPACAVNAIHKRDRVWILANNANARHENMRQRPIGSMASHASSVRHRGGRTHDNGKSKERAFCENIGNYGNGIRVKAATSNSFATNAQHNGSLAATNGRPTRDNARSSEERSDKLQQPSRTSIVSDTAREQSQSNATDSLGERLERAGRAQTRFTFQGRSRLTWPVSQPTIRRGNDGLSYRLDDGRLITAKQRTNALKGLGNAVVPQVVYEIFRIIQKCET